jgi:hypothetical protein
MSQSQGVRDRRRWVPKARASGLVLELGLWLVLLGWVPPAEAQGVSEFLGFPGEYSQAYLPSLTLDRPVLSGIAPGYSVWDRPAIGGWTPTYSQGTTAGLSPYPYPSPSPYPYTGAFRPAARPYGNGYDVGRPSVPTLRSSGYDAGLFSSQRLGSSGYDAGLFSSQYRRGTGSAPGLIYGR